MSPRFAGEYWWPFGISNGLAGVLVTWAEPRSIFVFFFGILDAMIAPTPFDILPFLVLGSFSWTLFVLLWILCRGTEVYRVALLACWLPGRSLVPSLTFCFF